MVGKQPEVTARTQRRLMEAFCLLYAERPLADITVLQITHRAGCNRGTFYRYFSGIEDVLEYAQSDLLDCVTEAIDPGECFGSFPSEEALSRVISIFNERSAQVKAFLGPYGSLGFLTRLKERICETSGMRHDQENDPALPYLIEFRISTALSLFQLWLQRGQRDLSAQQLFALVQQLSSSGVTGLAPQRR